MLLKIEQEMRDVTKNSKDSVISREFSIFFLPFRYRNMASLALPIGHRRGRFVKSNAQIEHNYCVGNV